MKVKDESKSEIQGLKYSYYEGSWDQLPDFNVLEIVATGVTSTFDIFQSSIMHSGIIISDKQLNRWGLPEEATIRQLESLSIDAVIDLNPEEDPVHRMLIRSSKSPIKIGFQSKRHTSLFNITVENNREEIIEYQFNQINQLLGLA